MSDPETLQAIIRSWLDFGWELLAHPLISFLLGFFGGAHIDGGVRRLYGKTGRAIKNEVTKIAKHTDEKKP